MRFRNLLIATAAVAALALPVGLAAPAFANPTPTHYVLATTDTAFGGTAHNFWFSGTFRSADKNTRGIYYVSCSANDGVTICDLTISFASRGALNATFDENGTNTVTGPITGGTRQFAGATGTLTHVQTGTNTGIATIDLTTV